MTTINVPEDGSCLFRCILLFLNKEHQNYSRFKNGKVKNKQMNIDEHRKCMEIRQEIVNYLESNKETYDTIFYDDHEHYNNIDERINMMRKSTEYGGIIEIDCAVKLYDIPIEIFVDRNTRSFNKIAEFKHYNSGKYKKKKKQVCKLLLNNDHYNLISST